MGKGIFFHSTDVHFEGPPTARAYGARDGYEGVVVTLASYGGSVSFYFNTAEDALETLRRLEEAVLGCMKKEGD